MIHLIFKENLFYFLKNKFREVDEEARQGWKQGESMRQVQQQRLGMMAFRSTRVMVETKSKEPRCILEA